MHWVSFSTDMYLVDKKMQCASAGFAWSALLAGDLPLLLTDCAAYYVVSFPPSRKYENAGEHDVALVFFF